MDLECLYNIYPVRRALLRSLSLFDRIRLTLTFDRDGVDELRYLVNPLLVKKNTYENTTTTTTTIIERTVATANLFNHMVQSAILELISLQNLICYECVTTTATTNEKVVRNDTEERNDEPIDLDRFVYTVRKMFELSSNGSLILGHQTIEYRLYLQEKPEMFFSFAVSDRISAIRTNNWQKVAIGISMYLISQRNNYLVYCRNFFIDKFDLSFKFMLSRLEYCPYMLLWAGGDNAVYSDAPAILLSKHFETIMDSIVEIYRDFSTVKPIGFLAQTNIDFEEHALGLEHHRCAMNYGKLFHGYHHGRLIVYQTNTGIVDNRFLLTLKATIDEHLVREKTYIKFLPDNNEFEVCVSTNNEPLHTLFKITLVFINSAMVPIYAVPLFINNDTRFTLRDNAFMLTSVRWKFYVGSIDDDEEDEEEDYRRWRKFTIFYHDEEKLRAKYFLKFVRAFIQQTKQINPTLTTYNYFHLQDIRKADTWAPLNSPALLSYCVILKRFSRGTTNHTKEPIQCHSVSAKYTTEGNTRSFVMHVEC